MLTGLTVIVAGANGRMGRLFAGELEAQGAAVLRLGRRELADGAQLSASAGHLTISPHQAGHSSPQAAAKKTGAPGEAGAPSAPGAPHAPAAPSAAQAIPQPAAPPASEREAAFARADVVLLCVPVALTGPVARRIAALFPVPAHAVWVDVASVKTRPMQHLAGAVAGPVVGTHPLFGPSARPGSPERRVAVIPGERAKEAHLALVERLFQGLGCHTFRATAKTHDQAMGLFQSLNFLTSAALLAVAAKTPGIAPYLTPSFRRRAAASELIVRDDGELFTGLTFQNDELPGLLAQFTASLERLTASPKAALDELAAARAWWEEEKEAEGCAPPAPPRKGIESP